MKFKKGDVITTTEKNIGLSKAVVAGVVKQKGKQYYRLKIVCGIALLPVDAESNYKILEE